MKKTTLLFVSVISCFAAMAQPLLLRHPAINNNGSVIAFSFQGDIWTVPAAGGRAARLTVHEGYEANPLFSPDGKMIAFSGARFGNNDVFVMPSEGGMPKRLTFHSAADNLTAWQNSSTILFTSARE
ncbi:MAG: peptidase S41, partial [Chitinophagaceae bacterium]|nr:peptidase S41 [Chitinophagaceae bacterium]